MKQAKWGRVLLAAALVGITGAALAADAADFGKREYDLKCASCHGLTGKGDGYYKPFLNVAPSNLSVITKKNNGVFPLEYVVQSIDGRGAVKAHGPREMPIWGRDFALEAGEKYFDVPYDGQAVVRARILALVDYLNRLQVY
ncbi:MAG: c-type cytochrome [Betaproteobacteria bacterium]|nr:c-type cytochrome [Betaproteobacteria bacterium]